MYVCNYIYIYIEILQGHLATLPERQTIREIDMGSKQPSTLVNRIMNHPKLVVIASHDHCRSKTPWSIADWWAGGAWPISRALKTPTGWLGQSCIFIEFPINQDSTNIVWGRIAISRCFTAGGLTSKVILWLKNTLDLTAGFPWQMVLTFAHSPGLSGGRELGHGGSLLVRQAPGHRPRCCASTSGSWYAIRSHVFSG